MIKNRQFVKNSLENEAFKSGNYEFAGIRKDDRSSGAYKFMVLVEEKGERRYDEDFETRQRVENKVTSIADVSETVEVRRSDPRAEADCAHAFK